MKIFRINQLSKIPTSAYSSKTFSSLFLSSSILQCIPMYLEEWKLRSNISCFMMKSLAKHNVSSAPRSVYYTKWHSFLLSLSFTSIMAVRVVEFSNRGYKIRKIFAKESTCSKEIIEFWIGLMGRSQKLDIILESKVNFLCQKLSESFSIFFHWRIPI